MRGRLVSKPTSSEEKSACVNSKNGHFELERFGEIIGR